MKQHEMQKSLNTNPTADFYYKMADHTDKVYKFVKLYNDYANTPRDYGVGEKINMLGIHIMTAIGENPGITVTELADQWFRTQGSISQVLTQLSASGYITKKRDGKNTRLYPTAAGMELSSAHKYYDAKKFKRRLDYFLLTCTEQEIDAFYKVLDCYTQLLLDHQGE